MVYWGAQGMGVHGNGVRNDQGVQGTRVHTAGVRGISGCTGHKGTQEWGAWFIGVHAVLGWGFYGVGGMVSWGMWQMWAAREAECMGLGCDILGCAGDAGTRGSGVHGNGVQELLGCRCELWGVPGCAGT